MTEFFIPKSKSAGSWPGQLIQSMFAGLAYSAGVASAALRLSKDRNIVSLASDPAYRKSVLLTLDWSAREHGKRGNTTEMRKAIDLIDRIEDTFPNCPHCDGTGRVFAGERCGPCSGRGTLTMVRE